MKNVYVLYYDEMWVQEPILALNRVRDENIVAVALESRPYMSYEKLVLLPDKTIDQINLDEVDILIVPGGDGTPLLDNPVLKQFFQEVNRRNKPIAGICFGSTLMANYGVLENRRCTGGGSGIGPTFPWLQYFSKSEVVMEQVVIDGNTISAMGCVPEQFAIAVEKALFSSELR